jgi:phosphate transport system substrate-binding protein
MIQRTLISLSLLVGLFACGPTTTPRYSDTYSNGTIKVAVDHSFLPLVDHSLAPYFATYPSAHLDVAATTEDSALRLLAIDSIQLAIATRELKPEELERLTKDKVKPIYTKIAVDAVALIVNKNNGDSLLQNSEVKSILNGGIKKWDQLPTDKRYSKPYSKQKGEIVCVFDNDRSSNLTYMQKTLGLTDQDLKNAKVFAAGNNQAVIDYVATHPEALGFVGVSWVFDSTGSNQWKKDIQVVALADASSKTEVLTEDYYQPYQAYLGDKSYPFRRDIFWIYRSGRTGLAMGYAAYMASDKGQRIALKQGLLPSNVPMRLVKMNKE